MAVETRRLVDQYPSHRTKPMQVLCFGQSRTGTMGLQLALNKLGYNCWHFGESLFKRPKKDFPLMAEALDLKEVRVSAYGPLQEYSGDPSTKPPAWGRKEWDVILGDYDAVADNPAASFVDDLLEAYPDTKVILTVRDVDSWMVSVSKGLAMIHTWKSWPLVAPWDKTTVGPFWTIGTALNLPTVFANFSLDGPVRQAYLDHYDYVRKVVPPERLLEFDVRQGWGPLCQFLDKSVPNEPYPHINESKDFVQIHLDMWWMAVGKMVLKIGTFIAVPAAAWAYWWWYKKQA